MFSLSEQDCELIFKYKTLRQKAPAEAKPMHITSFM